MKNGKNSVKRRDWKMATGTAPTMTSTQPQHQHSQYSNATVSSISLSNGTVSNGTVSNLGNYYTTNSNAVWSVYSNYMKPKSFKLR